MGLSASFAPKTITFRSLHSVAAQQNPRSTCAAEVLIKRSYSFSSTREGYFMSGKPYGGFFMHYSIQIMKRTLLPSLSALQLHQPQQKTHVTTLRFFSNSSPPRLPAPRNRLAQGAGLVGAASLLFGKTKYLLAALKVTKLASLGSMVFTIGTYSMFFGWPYATGMVGLILVHETGHALMMIHRNIPFSPMVFIPFAGAVIAMKRNPRDAWEDALVAYGGPALGSLGAAAVAVGAQATDSQLLYALADFGFMINLFNLMPLGMMDGGRIAGALSPYAGVVGLGIGGTLAYSLPIMNPMFYLIMIAGGYETFQRFYNPAHTPPNYYKITTPQRVMITTGYFGLIGALILAMGLNAQNRKPPEVLIQERDREKFWKDAPHMDLH
jgi:Zn-dependent protease